MKRSFATLAASLGLGLALTLPGWAQQVRLQTSAGDIVLELDAARAPKTVDNFLQYAKEGHFDGTIFHRVIPGFMIQGGGMRADMSEKPTRGPIPLESRNGLVNARGTVAMARTADPNSATAQFFINLVDNPALDQQRSRDGFGYAVFGRVVSGMDVVDRISKVKVSNRGMHENVPEVAVVIRGVQVFGDAVTDKEREERNRRSQREAADAKQQRDREALGDRR